MKLEDYDDVKDELMKDILSNIPFIVENNAKHLHWDEQKKIYCGTCPEKTCMTLLHYDITEKSVECDQCLQTHQISALLNTYVTELEKIPSHHKPQCKTDFIKVDGLSNFRCKLLSPCLSNYGMKNGKSVLLKDIGHAETIDCGILGSRSFMISPVDINIEGYGKYLSDSSEYLKEFFDQLKDFHGGEERLVAIHTDGDGHCLLHAISRASTGRQLFWHGLRKNLQDHMKEQRSRYQALLSCFFNEKQWDAFIEESDPNCASSEGYPAYLGLPHIFALSNILKRPVILFDSLQTLQNSGGYAGLFVPALVEPSQCLNRSPLCISWAGPAHNHFVALVAVKGRPLPSIPEELIPTPWAVGHEVAKKYLTYNEDGSLTVCDGKALDVSYLQKLTKAMEKPFIERHNVSPALIEEVYRCCFNSFPASLDAEGTAKRIATAVSKRCLFRCLDCLATSGIDSEVKRDPAAIRTAFSQFTLQSNEIDGSHQNNIFCSIIRMPPADRDDGSAGLCDFCGMKNTRLVDCQGKVCYRDGDLTDTPSILNGRKVYWGGREYDNEPLRFTLAMKKSGKDFEIPIMWFHGDSNYDLNSNCMTEAGRVVQDHFAEESDTDELTKEIAKMIEKKCVALGQLTPEKKVVGDTQHKFSAKKVRKSLNKEHGEETCKANSAHDQEQLRRKEPIANRLQSASTSPSSSRSTSPVSLTVDTSKITIKICMGREKESTKVLKLDANVNLKTLQDEIHTAFSVEPSQQVLKVGFPPKLLVSPPCGGALGLKSGEKVDVRVKKTDPQEKINQGSEMGSRQAETASSDSVQSSEPVTMQESTNGLPTKWKFAIQRPELFYPGGYYYEEFKKAAELKPGQHCCLSVLPGLEVYYNDLHDRIELFLEPMGHIPVDEKTKLLIEEYFYLQESGLHTKRDSNIIQSLTQPVKDVKPDFS